MPPHDRAPRELSSYERAVIERLLEPAFPGRDQVKAIVGESLVRTVDDNGSFEFVSDRPQDLSEIRHVIPTEATCVDLDGITIYYLLHTADGKLSELEIYKEDLSPIQKHSSPDRLEVFAPEADRGGGA